MTTNRTTKLLHADDAEQAKEIMAEAVAMLRSFADRLESAPAEQLHRYAMVGTFMSPSEHGGDLVAGEIVIAGDKEGCVVGHEQLTIALVQHAPDVMKVRLLKRLATVIRENVLQQAES